MTMSKSFPYKKPSKELLKEFQCLSILNKITPPLCKLLLDKTISICLILFLVGPLFLCCFFFAKLESLFFESSRGPFLYYYDSVSQAKTFRKYKIRYFLMKFVDLNKPSNDWLTYSKIKSNKQYCTFFGYFFKKYYLDELPQFFSVLIGDISLIGPRPLSVLHYKRDIKQGNYIREKLIAGIIGPGHLNKGLKKMGDPREEFLYADLLNKNNCIKIFLFDIKVIFKTVLLIFKGGGH